MARDDTTVPGSKPKDTVRVNLNAILLSLVSRDEPVCGQRLMETLDQELDCRFSPGTIYPRLATLEDNGIIERRDLSQRKVFSVTDPVAAACLLEAVRDDLLDTARYIQENAALDTQVTDAEMEAEIARDLL